jgi:Mce-associated membrane protein
MSQTAERPRTDEAAAPPRRRRRRPVPRLRRQSLREAVAGTVVVLLLAGLVWALLLDRAARAEDRAGADATAVARQTVVNLLTIDAGRTDEAMKLLEASATGEFAQQLIAQGDAFHQVVDDSQVHATGTVSEAGVRTVSDTAATVLVSAVWTVQNSNAPQGEPRQYRMVLDLVHPDGGADPEAPWLVQKLEFVP